MANPTLDKLTPHDKRVEHHSITVAGHQWHYLLGNPPAGATPAATVLLVHGHPDLAFGWRYQVPYLLSLNMRVIVPDMLGYGQTDAPEAVEEYSHKKICSALAALVTHVAGGDSSTSNPPKIIIGGHDWGGAVVWKFAALWHREMVQGVFSICTPYAPPRNEYATPEQLVQMVPNFRYQLQLAGPELEETVTREGLVGRYLACMFGTRTEDGRYVITPETGVDLARLPGIKGSGRLVAEEEMEFYEAQFKRNGLHGPLNWYRTGKVNWEEELELAEQGPARWRVAVPSMMIVAKKDPFLPPEMSAKMDSLVDDLVKHEVNSNHWATWEVPDDVNRHIGAFLDKVLGGGQAPKASI